LISLTTVLPFLWTIATSFKSDGEILSGSMSFIPQHFTWDHYKEVFAAMPFLTYLKNSLILALGGVATNLFFGSLAGYSFGQLRFKGKKVIFLIFLASMMIPSIVTMIPTFIVLRGFPLAGGNDFTGSGGLGLINTYWAILLPGAAGAFSIFFMKQFFEQLPRELGESARIDGAGEFKIFWTRVFSVSKTSVDNFRNHDIPSWLECLYVAIDRFECRRNENRTSRARFFPIQFQYQLWTVDGRNDFSNITSLSIIYICPKKLCPRHRRVRNKIKRRAEHEKIFNRVAGDWFDWDLRCLRE
jgi:ABC-type spermidine/putrescine transport system permease subunit II